MSDDAGLIVDLSHYNTSVDFAAMKAGGIAAVILKASQGTTFTDPAFASHTAAAKAAGLLVGAYHFFGSSTDPAAQASYFLGIAGAAGVTVLAVDFEPSTAGEDETNAAVLCQSIHDKTGNWPLLYTGKWSVAPSNPIFSKCPLWLAEWTTATTPNLPPGFDTWKLWQFESAIGVVPGVPGACSRSRINGSLSDLQSFWNSTATTPVMEATATIPVPTEVIDSSGNKIRLIWGTAAASIILLGIFGGIHHYAPHSKNNSWNGPLPPIVDKTSRSMAFAVHVPDHQYAELDGMKTDGIDFGCPPNDLRRFLKKPPPECYPTSDLGR